MTVILGVDPSLSGTGLAAIVTGDKPALCFARTIRAPKTGDLIDRLVILQSKLLLALEEFERYILTLPTGTPVEIAIEDATSLKARGARGRGPKTSAVSSARLGAAVGAVMLTLVGVSRGRWTIHCYTVDEWVPKARIGKGGWTAPVRHDRVVGFYRELDPALEEATDDEVMAYALAMFHHRRSVGK